MTVHSDVGHLIDFYNIQYYNQGNNPFESFEEIFLESTPNSPETSVKELLDKDIPIEMLVVGKPGSPEDVYSTGYVEPS
jgi:chitinase